MRLAAGYGGYASFTSGTMSWLSDILNHNRAANVAYGSFGGGLVILSFGVIGCFGAYRRSKPCLCIFGLLVLILLIMFGASVTIMWETKKALNIWSDGGYGLESMNASTNALLEERTAMESCAASSVVMDESHPEAAGHMGPQRGSTEEE